MAVYQNRTAHAIDLTGGGDLGPGETANIDPSNPHEAALISLGALVFYAPGSPPVPTGITVGVVAAVPYVPSPSPFVLTITNNKLDQAMLPVELDNPLGIGGAPLGAQPLTIQNPQATGWTADVVGKVNGLLVRHAADLQGAVGDAMDIFHKSTGDGLYVQHDGGQLPASTFTAATASGNPTLTVLSSSVGLTKGTPITGAGIPPGTTLAANANVGAATVLMSNPASATASGVTVSIAATSIGGGNAALNVLIPYHADSHGTGRDGTIVSTRQGMQGLVIQNQQTTAGNGATGGNSIYVEHYTGAAAVAILNQFTGNPAAGNGPAMVINDYSTVSTLSISKQTAPSAGNAAVMVSSPLAGPLDMYRANDSAGVGRFLAKSDGTLALGTSYPGSAPRSRFSAEVDGAGIKTIATWLNTGVALVQADGDGIEMDWGGANPITWASLQAVVDSVAGGNTSLRFNVKAGGVSGEKLRLSGVGIGFYGHAPVAQPAAPVTLADVIAVIRGCGLSA